MRAGVVGEVVRSNHPRFAEGAHVVATTGVQEYAVSDGKGVQVVDPERAPLPTYLGTLGMTGLTAYFGLLDVGRPEQGETVVVSGAAGATGSVVGQIAKIKGCRVVGIAGGAEKCRTVVEELGFDACLDYKAGDLKAALRARRPRPRRRVLRQRRRRGARHRPARARAARPGRAVRRDQPVQRGGRHDRARPTTCRCW